MGIEHVVEDYDDGSNNNDTDAGLSTKTPFEVLFSKLEDDTPTTAALDDGAMSAAEKLERQQMIQKQVNMMITILWHHYQRNFHFKVQMHQSCSSINNRYIRIVDRRMNSLTVNNIIHGSDIL